MKASEMTEENLAKATNDEIAQLLDFISIAFLASKDHSTDNLVREAAARLRRPCAKNYKCDSQEERLAVEQRKVVALRAKLKVAEDALVASLNYKNSEELRKAQRKAKKAIAAIREEGSDPCNARDGEGSSLRIGWEGEKEYCVVAKYRQDLQVELEDYDYHRVTGPLPLEIAKHWLDYNKRIRTKSEDPKILVREVSKWRLFAPVVEGGES